MNRARIRCFRAPREPNHETEQKMAAEEHDRSMDLAEYPQMELLGTVTVIGDIVEPAVPEAHWESLGWWSRAHA